MKVLKHFLYIQYECGMQSVVVYSLNHDTTTSFGIQSPYPNFPNISSRLHMYNSVMLHPYAHPQHMKVLNHFLYIQYRCGMQSVVVYSLNHDTTMSYGIHLTPVSLIWPSPAHRYNSVRVHPYAHPQHMKVLKHFL